MVKSSSTKPQKTAFRLAQRIVRDIEQQGLSPGQMLPPERSMMDAYATGRGTLRESLRFLELQGVLSFKPGPGGGPVVRRPTAEHLATALALILQFDGSRYRTVAEARSALEPVMAAMAAQHITHEQLTELGRSVVDLEIALDNTDEYRAVQHRFHRIIAHASGNSLFAFLLEAMVNHLESAPGALPAPASSTRRRSVVRAHRRIHAAIAEADAEAAGEQMRRYLDDCLSYAGEHHPELLNRQVSWPG